MTESEVQEILALLEAKQQAFDGLLATLQEPVIITPSKPEPVILRGKCVDYNLEDSKGDIIEYSAFHSCLQEVESVPIWFNHFEHLVAGKSLSFESKEDGLYVEFMLDMETPVGRDMDRLVKCGAINALSISFRYNPKIGANTYNDDCKSETIRVANSVTEISLATYPIGRRTMLEGTLKEREWSWQQYKERLFNGILIEHRLETPDIRKSLKQEYNIARDNFLSGKVIINQ